MRKYLVLALTLLTVTFGVSSSAFAVNKPDSIGMIKRVTGSGEDTPTRVYKLVRYGSNTNLGTNPSISAGEAVVYDTISDDGITIRRSTTSGDGAFAGIAVTEIPTSDASTGTAASDDLGRRNWGYIIVHGPTTAYVRAAGTNGNLAGDRFMTSSDAGAVSALSQGVTLVGTPTALTLKAYASTGGFFQDAADTTSTSVDVFVQAE